MLYNGLNQHLKDLFGEKVHKISIDLETTCPNRDGTISTGGCIFCNEKSTEPAKVISSNKEIDKQIETGMEYIKGRHGASKFLAYFQHNTNTYADIEKLSHAYFEAIRHPDVVGIDISTRPDCISDEVLDLLSKLNKETYLWVELGLQSIDNKILEFLNRGHNVEQFIDATKRLHGRDIKICAHVILGLPGETLEQIAETANFINKYNIEGIKVHNLHILKDTKLADIYNKGRLDILSLEDYSKRVAYLLERLNPNIIVHRFNSHSPRRITVAPDWSVNKLATFNAIENEIKRQETFQGKKYKES